MTKIERRYLEGTSSGQLWDSLNYKKKKPMLMNCSTSNKTRNHKSTGISEKGDRGSSSL
jgi:hypothetical protein